MSLEYKLKNRNDFTSIYVDLNTTNYTMTITKAGGYQFRLVVVNNEGLSSASKITVIDSSVKGKSVYGPLYGVILI